MPFPGKRALARRRGAGRGRGRRSTTSPRARIAPGGARVDALRRLLPGVARARDQPRARGSAAGARGQRAGALRVGDRARSRIPCRPRSRSRMLARQELELQNQLQAARARINALLHRESRSSAAAAARALSVPGAARARSRSPQRSRRAPTWPPRRRACARARPSSAGARRAFLPDLTLDGQLRPALGGEGAPADARLRDRAAAAARPAPGRRARGARAPRRRRESEARGIADGARLELQRARQELERARKLRALFDDELLPTARERVAAARAGFESGRNGFAELVDAEHELRSLRLGAEEALADESRRSAELAGRAGRAARRGQEETAMRVPTRCSALLASRSPAAPARARSRREVELDGLQLSAALAPAQGRVGANEILIELRDARGEPVEGAELRVKVHMHAMGAMPAMGGAAGVTRDGRRRATAPTSISRWAGAGWSRSTPLPPGAPPLRAEGSLTVGSEGLRLAALPRAGAPQRTGPAAEGAHPAEFSFEPARLQKSGVRTGRVERAELAPQRCAPWRAWPGTRAGCTTCRRASRGWIEELNADAVGKRVERGDVLFTLYSPELHAGQQELLLALRSHHGPGAATTWRGAARERLRLWGMAPVDLERVERAREPLDAVPFRSPVSGYVIEKDVVRGGAVAAGQRAAAHRAARPRLARGRPVRGGASAGARRPGGARVARVPAGAGVRGPRRLRVPVPRGRDAHGARARRAREPRRWRCCPRCTPISSCCSSRAARWSCRRTRCSTRASAASCSSSSARGRFRPQRVEVGARDRRARRDPLGARGGPAHRHLGHVPDRLREPSARGAGAVVSARPSAPARSRG